MKKLLPLLLLLPCLMMHAQTKIAYDYDNAGNRIARKVIIMAPKSTAQKPEAAPDSVAEVLSNVEILAYPNPVKEILHVEAKGLKEEEKISIMLFGSQGALLLHKETSEPSTPIPMDAYRSGVYILRVSAGGEKTEIKIIKQ